jgi:homoisocitrate dehydrogenase
VSAPSLPRICVIEGDGIGHEVIPAAVEVLEATGLQFEAVHAVAGWDCFQQQGTALPDETLEAARSSDAILFGAISSPSRRIEGYSSPILGLRQKLGLYGNLRPCRSQPIATSRPNVDLLIVRENSEGLYIRQERSDGDRAIAERLITREASERVARLACELATQRRRQLTVVHKANVLTLTCGLFRQATLEVAADYPALAVEELLVDTAALRLVTHPEHFDVIVTTNLFGDILSDEAAGLVGGLGLAPSANLGAPARSGRRRTLFEPVHGSAPDIAGQGIANPIAAILAVAMLLDHLHERERAAALRAAVGRVLEFGPHTPDLGGSSTTAQVTQAILSHLSRQAAPI